MPRKTDGMPFEIHPSPKKAKDGRNILYVRPRSNQKITYLCTKIPNKMKITKIKKA